MPQRVRILFAVRDVHAADLLRLELDDEEHCAIDVVGSGIAALHAAARMAPHVMVIDTVLPGMDGLRCVDCLRSLLGREMPRLIAGAQMPMADSAWRERGAACVLRVPWQREKLREAVLEQVHQVRSAVNWQQAKEMSGCAHALLEQMGMRTGLKGCTYLAYAAALACERESRMRSVGAGLYQPIAMHFHTSAASVERLIRHAVESTMDDIGAAGVYRFFGNTIDPMRGKPTNAQMIALLAQRMRLNAYAQIEK